MRNVFRVFGRDLKRIATTPAAWLVALFLIVLPSLYTWFNVLGFWNPYENTGNLRVCVVDEDRGVNDETLGELDLGSQVVEQLKQNTQLGWQFVDRDEAMEEVESGRAYAAFVIPEDFSADIATFATGDIERPQLEYYVNEKTGPVAPKITDTGASTLDTTINETFVSTVSSAVATAVDDALGESRADLVQKRSDAVSGLDEALGDVSEARTSLADLKTAADEAVGKVDAAKQALSDAKNGIVLLSAGLGDVSSLAGDVNTGIVKFSTSMGGVLDKGSAMLSKTASQTDSAISATSGAIVSASADVDAALERGQAVVQENAQVIALLRSLQESLPDGSAGKDELGAVIASLERSNADAQAALEGLDTLSSDTSSLAASAAQASSSVNGAVQDTLSSVDGYRATLSDTTIPAVSGGLSSMTSATSGLAAGVSGQTVLVDQALAVLDQLNGTLSLSSDALSQSDSLLADIEGDLQTMKTDVAALGTSGALAQLFGEDGAIDPEAVADFMMSPTEVQTEELYPLNAYGSGMAPLFINLTLWIGVFMLMVIMRIEVDDEGIENLTVAQRFVGRWLLLAVMVVLQAAVCCAGCLAIGVQSASPPAFFLTAAICSLAYLCIQYTLSTTLQHVGKALCVILVFVQIPGATGLYPIEMTPAFFQAVYPLFPFTYGINAVRETISGFYDGAWLSDVGVLVAFALAFAVIGVLVRPHLSNLNRLFARRLEESDIINGEPVRLPERRYSMQTLLRVLSDREEYRSEIARRAERFMALYPKFKHGAVAVGIVVPVAVTLVFAVTATEKVVMLTAWIVWLAIVAAFLIAVEYVRDNLMRQASLDAMSDDEVRTLYVRRNAFGSEKGRCASSGGAAAHGASSGAAGESAVRAAGEAGEHDGRHGSHDERGRL